MTGISLTLWIDDRQLAGAIAAMIEAGEDLSPAMGEIAGVMYDATLERFEMERDPLGVPWKPSQRALEEGGKTLQETRQLHDAVVPEFDRSSAVVGVQDQPASRRDAPVRDYARIHQEGGVIEPRRAKALSFGGRFVSRVVMPRRAYLGFGAEEREAIPKILARHIQRAAQGGAA